MSEEKKEQNEPLSEADLTQVAGGAVDVAAMMQDTSQNKAKAATASAAAADSYLRG